MAETLFFRLNSEGVQWLLFDQFGNKKDQAVGDLSSFNDTFDEEFNGRAIFVVPGEDVLNTLANVPSRQYRQIVQAVPYVIEEQLATDVEDCFFALGERNQQGDILVSVCDLEQIEKWSEFLGELSLNIDTMVSETSLVHSNGIHSVIDGHRAHVRWANGDGLTVPSNQLPLVLGSDDDPEPLEIAGTEASLDAMSLQLGEVEATERQVIRTVIEEDGFYLLCRQFDGTETNLLQGPYKIEVKRSGVQVVWRSVAILSGIAVLLHLLLLTGQGVFLSRKADEYQSATTTLYKSVFPNDRNVRDVRRRWNSHLGRSSGSGSEFIALLAQATPGLTGAGLTLQNVNFNESRGDLILQVLGDRSESLVQYSQKLSADGLNAEIGTISQEGASVRGSIKIRGGSS
ncbi:MAG: hypothetical protein JJ921_04840 [Pseudomonadales bacterium]|nr:hypothetical protein [Pseudomonadales bacterium]MBO6565818.1 hypothetical protein [Pseudomonadales bacterium]MBO6595138.1 hypothetical protein [Pseudomonadales bacterium]MBO6701643.1 hypothetical protein [Pseudomonadales bacterium]MBO6821303.1 hypothetical protein [Pseudomonadales bacterium]